MNHPRENLNPFRSVLPYYGRRVDLCQLDKDGTEFAQKAIQQLLHRKLSLQVTVAGEHATTVNDLYFTAKNEESQHGPKTLGLGYPTLLTEDESGELTAAPLFIFRVELRASPTKINAWVLRHDTTLAVEPNRALIRYLQERFGLNLTPAFHEVARNFSRNGLEEFCANLAEATDTQNRLVYFTLDPFPTFDELGELSERGTIQPSAVLGLFPSQVRWTDTPDEIDLASVFAATSLPPAEGGHPFTLVVMSTEQSTAYTGALHEKTYLLDGAEGTGRTHTVNALLLNALSRGERTLVVSPNVPALRKQQQRLVQSGVLRFHFLFRNPLADKPQLLTLLRATAAGTGTSTDYDDARWNSTVDELTQAHRILRNAYRAVRRPVFHGADWTEVVGWFLRAQRVESREVLSTLPTNEFLFSEEEYAALGRSVRTARPLYEKVGTAQHPLLELHERLFLEHDHEEARAELDEQLNRFRLDLDRLQERLIRRTNGYAEKLGIHYRRYAERLRAQIADVEEQFQRDHLEYGSRYVRSGDTRLRLLSPVSDRRRNVLAAREEMVRTYRVLLRTHAKHPYFEYAPRHDADARYLSEIPAELQRLTAALDAWEARLDEVVREEALAVSPATARADLDFDRSTAQLFERTRALVADLNERRLYGHPIPASQGSQLELVEQLDRLDDQLARTQAQLADFKKFHAWHRFHLRTDGGERKLIDALIAQGPKTWTAAFESWYLDRVLRRAFSEHLPTDDAALERYLAVHRRLESQFLDRIVHLHQQRERRARTTFRSRDRANHDLIFRESTRTVTTDADFRELAATGLDALTATLPVLFATPDVVRRMLPQRAGYFDRVIFLNAEAISTADATATGALGKRCLLVGDAGARVPGGLLERMQELQIPTTTLHERHTKSLTGLERYERQRRAETAAGVTVTTEYVAGPFSDPTSTNEVEAQRALQLLNLVGPTPQRTLPRVGIVCFTVEQRNLIAAYLLRIRQRGEASAEKIEQLQRNGMGVYHLEEIGGRDLDVLIVSTTYGVTGAEGRMTKQSVQLDRQMAYLYQLLHKTARETHVLHSFPDDILEEYLDEEETQGMHLLAAYLKYQEARAANRDRQAAGYLKLFGEDTGLENSLTTSAFAREVAQSLGAYVPRYRLQAQAVLERGSSVPLLLRAEYPGEPDWVICPEGFVAKTPETDFRWEQAQRDALTTNDRTFHPIYSVQWWREPERAAKRLAGGVIREDSRYGLGMI